jgi:hypothetical protein
MFEFHSGFWINLHHFLYREAIASAPQKGSRPLPLLGADADELKALSADEKADWDKAVAYYRDSLIQRDLLFDAGMESIKNKLEDSETSPDLASTSIVEELKGLLVKVAPIYRRHWWPRQDEQNRQWISELQALIDQHGDAIRSSLVRIYDVPWPEQTVRVDIVAYANWAGAYTSLEPTRPTISSTDPTNQGAAALEIVFHETSHGMIDKVMDAINRAERAADAASKSGPIHLPRDLWHQVLFYTSGELVVRRIPGYVPYADKNGLWIRTWSGPDRTLIERYWKPHMDGSVGLQQSLTGIVDDLAAAAAKSTP